MTQVAYPFKLDLMPPGSHFRFVRGIELEDLSIHGVYYPGRAYNEFQQPAYFRLLSLFASPAQMDQNILLSTFQGLYPHHPHLHPDCTAHTPEFDHTHRKLCGKIACIHAIHLSLVRIKEDTAILANEIALISTDTFIMAFTGLLPSTVIALGTVVAPGMFSLSLPPWPAIPYDAFSWDAPSTSKVVGTWGHNDGDGDGSDDDDSDTDTGGGRWDLGAWGSGTGGWGRGGWGGGWGGGCHLHSQGRPLHPGRKNIGIKPPTELDRA
ncbi:hypothetical protein C8R44DRAFT_887809 [Mycena epipterygia]|nr:hypothetical protein C8R44DRAFT_887809 [Mycena epipterygia]